jgi:hypothetical protein
MCFETQTCNTPSFPFIEVFALLGYYTALFGSYRYFGTVCRFRLQESNMEFLTLENGTDSLFRNVSNYQSTLCNSPQERRPRLHHGLGLKLFLVQRR